MSGSALRNSLGQLPFFSVMSSKQVDLVTSFASAMRYTSQQRLFKSDTDADKFYIIRDGKVGVEIPAGAGEPRAGGAGGAPRGGPSRGRTVGRGGVPGCWWVIPPYRWLFDARALTA